MRFMCRGLILVMILLLHSGAWAAHPLITDDSGTQGAGKFQLEINGQYDHDKEAEAGVTTEERGVEIGATLSYGILEHTDIVIGVPYQWYKTRDNGVVTAEEHGISDAIIELKWRFYEKDGLGLALKPGVSLPTGDDEKGLGTGKTGYHLFFIGSKEAEPWAFHANLGYIRNENKVAEEEDIWHASVAATYGVMKDMKLVGNIGIEKNPDRAAGNDPAFLILGAIYSIKENLDIDAGAKFGLTSSEADLSLMAGMAFRF